MLLALQTGLKPQVASPFSYKCVCMLAPSYIKTYSQTSIKCHQSDDVSTGELHTLIKGGDATDASREQKMHLGKQTRDACSRARPSISPRSKRNVSGGGERYGAHSRGEHRVGRAMRWHGKLLQQQGFMRSSAAFVHDSVTLPARRMALEWLKLALLARSEQQTRGIEAEARQNKRIF